jgi:hypothetical protein
MLAVSSNDWNKHRIVAVEAVGTVFIIMLGSALHFTYALSGNNALVGVFSAVNESVWEHLKLVFWPALLWLLMALYLLRVSVGNFFFAKTVGAYTMVLFIPAVFYNIHCFHRGKHLSSRYFQLPFSCNSGSICKLQTLHVQGQATENQQSRCVSCSGCLAVLFVVFNVFFRRICRFFQDSTTGQYGA